MTEERIFRFRLPFRTRCGWPARLVGVLQRRSNPYVVAVWNPNFKSEELHAYPEEGVFPTGGANHPLDLVELNDDDYYAWASPESGKDEMPVHAHVVREPDWPRNCNPLRRDRFSMMTELVRGWYILHEGYDNRENQFPLREARFYNSRTGNMFALRFTPMDPREVEALNATASVKA